MSLAVAVLLAVQVADAHWAAVLACPKVSVPGSSVGTGVVIGVRDGFAYVLTASHVATLDQAVEVGFTTRGHYPKPVWFGEKAEVVARWPDPDLALVRFPIGKQAVPVLPLAPAWDRPKAFPAPGMTLGVGHGQAATARPDVIVAKEFVRREGKQPAFFWRTEVTPEEGRSGGPLLDSRGRVIGIAIAYRDGAGYYAHHDEILAALKRNKEFSWLIPAGR